MMRPISIIVRVLSIAMMLAISMTAMPAAAQGNSEAAHACQDGGYADLVGVTNGAVTFLANPGECVQFAAQGGQIVPLAIVQPCLDGGYVNYADPDGGPFTSEAGCIAFVAEGGDLDPWVVEPYLDVQWVTRTFESGEVQVSAIITGAGLQPGAGLDFYLNGRLSEADIAIVAEDGTLYFDRTGLAWFSCGFTSAYYQIIDRDGQVIQSSDGVAEACP